MLTSAVCGRLEPSAYRCPKRLPLANVAGDFPPASTVYYHFRNVRMSGLWHRTLVILWATDRKRGGEDSNASIVDSQSVKTSEEGGPNGCDDHKNTKGRKRPLLVGTLGVPLSFPAHTRWRTTGPSRSAFDR